MSKNIAVAALVLMLALVNWLIIGKERHLATGRIVYLALAPVDPRSLMQGDYMALRFEVADQLSRTLGRKDDQAHWREILPTEDDFVVISLDDRNIGTFKESDPTRSLAKNELRLHYRVRDGKVKLATNAFFFQEGHAHFYEAARYGQFRVDGKGELLLTAMYDKDLKKLGPPETTPKKADKWPALSWSRQ